MAELNQRDCTIDGLKGVAIFMVVYGHAIASFSGLGVGSLTMPIQRVIYLVHMPLFMFLSGIVSKRFIDGNKGFIESTWKTTRQLLLPMFFWCILSFTVKCLISSESYVFELKLFLKDIYSALYGGYWFIWSLFFCRLYTKLCARLVKRRMDWMLVALVLFLLLPSNKHLLFLHLNETKFMLPFYVGGYLLSRIDWKSMISRKWIMGGGISLYSLCCLIVKEDWYIYYLNLDVWRSDGIHDYMCYLFLVVAGFAGISVLLSISQSVNWSANSLSLLCKLGQFTFGIYMIQGILFNVVLNKNEFCFGGHLLWFILSIIITIICFYLVHLIKQIPFLSKTV